jgi:hypothetical protein
MAFAEEMRAAGYPAVVVYLDDENHIRIATPAIPVAAMTMMLETARDSYAAHERRKLN